jgi:hypothetical protein
LSTGLRSHALSFHGFAPLAVPLCFQLLHSDSVPVGEGSFVSGLFLLCFPSPWAGWSIRLTGLGYCIRLWLRLCRLCLRCNLIWVSPAGVCCWPSRFAEPRPLRLDGLEERGGRGPAGIEVSGCGAAMTENVEEVWLETPGVLICFRWIFSLALILKRVTGGWLSVLVYVGWKGTAKWNERNLDTK